MTNLAAIESSDSEWDLADELHTACVNKHRTLINQGAESMSGGDALMYLLGKAKTGVYAHYKHAAEHPRIYAFMPMHLVNDVVMTEYHSLYDSDDPKFPVHYGQLFNNRPLVKMPGIIEEEGFLEPVDDPDRGYRGPRFKLIKQYSRQELQIFLDNRVPWYEIVPS